MVGRFRSLALLVVAVSLLAPFTAAVSASAEDASPAPAVGQIKPVDSDNDGTLDAPDTKSAVVAAKSENQPVEDLSQRTGSVTVEANPDGTFTSKDFGEPVRIKRDGKWVDVDYNLAKQSDGSWAPKAAPIDVSIDGGSAKEAAKVTFDDGESLAVTWPTDLPAPTVDGGVATYKLSNSTDLIVAVTGSGVSTHLQLNEQPAADDPVFTFGLQTDSADVVESGDGLKLVDDDGHKVGSTSALVAWDDTTDAAGEPAEVVPLDANLDEVSSHGDVTKTNLELTPPDGFLSDPDTQYPVTIDPDIAGLGTTRDTWVRQDDTGSNGADYRLISGKINGSSNTNAAQSYLQFDNDQIAGKDIISAQLGLWQYYGYSCTDRRMNAYPVGESWTSGMAYPDRPSVLSVGDSTHVDTNRGATGCADGWTTLDVTNMTRSWADGDYTNNGIRLTADDTDHSSYERRFCSFNPDTSTGCNAVAKEPYLSVTYNAPPAASTTAPLVVQTPDAPVKVSAVVSDPEGGSCWAEFTVKRGTTTVFRGLSTSGSGTTQSVEVPNLPKGQYTVTARAYDGRLFSSNSTPSAPFTVSDDETGVEGDSFAASASTQAASITLPGATPGEDGQPASSQTFVAIAGLAGVPDDEKSGYAAVVSMRTSGWSSPGGVSMVDPDGEPPAAANFNIISSMSASTAVTSTSVVELSEDGDISVVNTSRDPVTVAISIQGWYSVADPPDATPIGPQPAPVVIADAPAQGPLTQTLTPPVDGAYTLAATTDNRVALSVGSTIVGHYSPNAIDDVGQTIPSTISAAGGNLVVTVAATSDTEYPITVVATFEATNPASSTVQDLYPDPERPIDPEDEVMTPEDVVEVTDEANQAVVDDIKDPDDSMSDEGIAAASGEVTTLAASHAKVKIPHWLYRSGYPVIPKYYVYDPHNKQGRDPARKGWHDYCSGITIKYAPDIGVPDGMKFYEGPFGGNVSYRGPCARHDLCIQWKQAPDRSYCDKKLKADIRQNCRHYLQDAGWYHSTWYEGPYEDVLDSCYSWAGHYYYWVRWATNKKTDSGHWGHHDNYSVYPTYRWDDWTQ